MMMNFSAREAFSSCCSQQKLRLHYTEKREFTKSIRKRERACVYVMYKLATARFCEDSFESIREKRLSNLLLEYEIPERTRNTKGDISVHKKTSIAEQHNN